MNNRSEKNLLIIRQLFQAFDCGQMEIVRGLLAEELYFQFGNFKPVTGIDAPNKVTGPLFERIQRIEHQLNNLWAPEPELVIAEMLVSYHRDDGRLFQLPCVNTFRLRADKIVDYRIYMDVTPILA